MLINYRLFLVIVLYQYNRVSFDTDGTLTPDQSSTLASSATYRGFAFFNDGFGLLCAASNSSFFLEIALGTAYNIATRGTTTVRTIDLTGGTALRGISIAGDYIYLSDNTNDRIVQASWDGANILNSVVLDSFGIGTAAPQQLQMKSDGTQFIYADYTTKQIYQYNLSTAHDLSTAILTKNLDLSSAFSTFLSSIWIDDTSIPNKLYAAGRDNNIGTTSRFDLSS